MLLTDVWAYHRDLADRHDRYRPAIAEFVEVARDFTDAQAYLAAQARRAEGTALWEDWFAAERRRRRARADAADPPLRARPWLRTRARRRRRRSADRADRAVGHDRDAGGGAAGELERRRVADRAARPRGAA